MANLKEIRTRLASVISTKQITSAMKMVSAAKLKKAQDEITRLKPYAQKLQEIISNLGAELSDENPYAKSRVEEKILIVVVTSNRGLCGGFNANVFKKAISLAQNEFNTQYEKGNVKFYAIGKKGRDTLKKAKYSIYKEDIEIFNNVNYGSVAEIANQIMDEYVNLQHDKVILVYNQFKNAATQILTAEQFLPIEKPSEANNSNINSDYIYEPSKDKIIDDIIPSSLRTQFYKAILDSNAAEHGARMTAMHKATENANELSHNLRIEYNKARQASITNAILEVVGGAEALSS